MSSGRFDDSDGDERARGTTDETVVRGSKGTKSTGKFSGANGANSGYMNGMPYANGNTATGNRTNTNTTTGTTRSGMTNGTTAGTGMAGGR